MKIPISRSTNLETGETVTKYAEVSESQLTNFFIGLFNRDHPGAYTPFVEQKGVTS